MGEAVKIAVLTANLGNFDTPVDPPLQETDVSTGGHNELLFHRFTDENFPPITGLTPRFQYRIPKMFGWQMTPDYDYYFWLDGSLTFSNPDSLQWFMNKLGDADILVFKHPWRDTAKEEVDHIEEYLAKGNDYISSRYQNGLHKEQYVEMQRDPLFVDDRLYTSTVFMYRNTQAVHDMLADWWLHTSRYFTVDQIVFPYLIAKHDLEVVVLQENQYKMPYLKEASKHK